VRRTHADLPNALARLAASQIFPKAAPSLRAAHEHIARARALAPGLIYYALTQAELFANARDFVSARAVVGPLMTPVYPEEVRNTARRLMSGLVDLERAISGRDGSPARSTEVAANGGSPAPSGRSRSVDVPDADAKPRDIGRGRFVPAFGGSRRANSGSKASSADPLLADAPARFMVRPRVQA
jgi:hypothetical protein